MKSRDTALRIMAAMVAGGIAVVACGGDDESSGRKKGSGGAAGADAAAGMGGIAGTSGMGGTAGGGGTAGVGGAAGAAGSAGMAASGGTSDAGEDSGGDASADAPPDVDDAMTSNVDSSMDAPADGPMEAGDASAATQSRMTVVLPGGTVQLLANDVPGNPLLFQAGAPFDHDGLPGQDIFVAEGSTRWRFDVTLQKFVEPSTLDDALGAPLAPDLLLSGDLQGSPEQMIGMFGSDARLYNFPAQQFGDAIALLEALPDAGTTPFTPRSAATVDLTGTGSGVTAVRSGSDALYIFDVNTGLFVSVVASPTSCSAPGPAIRADVIFSAALGVATETVILIEGSDAWLLDLSGAFPCFNGPIPLVDSSNDPITPDFAFGWDFDGNGTDDVVLFDRVPVPTT